MCVCVCVWVDGCVSVCVWVGVGGWVCVWVWVDGCVSVCVCVCGCVWVDGCVCVCEDYITCIWPIACLLIEGDEQRSSLILSKLLTPSLAYFLFSLLDRRGFVDESAVTIEEEPGTGYGATSSVPKVSSHGHP